MYLNMAQARPLAIAENHHFKWHTHEKELEDWWLFQSSGIDTLVTTQGERLIVLEPGERNDGPGPDIRKCHLLLDDVELCGDVEIHKQARDWFHHGHQRDPKYSRVILHVVIGAEGGPDLPTLVLQTNQPVAHMCLAHRWITDMEVQLIARLRFQRKVKHIYSLSICGSGLSPLHMGMIEIILNGKDREKRLNKFALSLNMNSWPDISPWKGSSQRFPGPSCTPDLLKRVEEWGSLFNLENWKSLTHEGWAGWDSEMANFRDLGLSRNQCREWIVNILAPFQGEVRGLKIWNDLSVFRRYGIEKRTARNAGHEKISRIIHQQTVLGWYESYCSQPACSVCPLLHPHHTLA